MTYDECSRNVIECSNRRDRMRLRSGDTPFGRGWLPVGHPTLAKRPKKGTHVFFNDGGVDLWPDGTPDRFRFLWSRFSIRKSQKPCRPGGERDRNGLPETRF